MGRAFSLPLKLLAPPPVAIAHARRCPPVGLPSSNSLKDDEHLGLRTGAGGGRGKYDQDFYLSRKGGRRRSATTPVTNSLPMPRSSFRLEILVPTHNKEGAPFSDADFEAFENHLLDTCSGFTRHGDVEEAWMTPEDVAMRDRSRMYTLILPTKDEATYRSLVNRYVESHFGFRQEAVRLD